MLLKLEDNTPNIYSEKSRDFQLLCRILDIYLNYLIQKSRAIIELSNVDTIQDNLLMLFARRLGFTTKKYFPPDILRNICKNYPEMIKYKGTTRAIELAVNSVLSTSKEVTSIEVTESRASGSIIITVTSDASDAYLEYLKELLTFIVPTGVTINFDLNLTKFSSNSDVFATTTTVKRIIGNHEPISLIINKEAGTPDFKNASWGNTTNDTSFRYSKLSLSRVINTTGNSTFILNKISDVSSETSNKDSD